MLEEMISKIIIECILIRIKLKFWTIIPWIWKEVIFHIQNRVSVNEHIFSVLDKIGTLIILGCVRKGQHKWEKILIIVEGTSRKSG